MKRKEKSIYKPTDMWTQEDDLLFLKYCPSKRDRGYHTIARDTSCRPSEILKLRIKDVVFKMAGDRQYAEIVVNGKTGTRSIPLINSVPYVKELIESHPMRNHDNAHLIYNENIFGRALSIFGLYCMYKRYKDRIFPSLLKDPLLDANDKAKIKDLLQKPFNPYIQRHSSLTQKSKILKEHVLRQHAGWQPTSNMHQKYIHYLGNESNQSILEAYGVIDKNKKEIDQLKPRTCPNCNEGNKIDSRFCSKCKMVLTYDEYADTLEKQRIKEDEIENLKEVQETNSSAIADMSDLLLKAMQEIRDLKQQQIYD
jgi:integrase